MDLALAVWVIILKQDFYFFKFRSGINKNIKKLDYPEVHISYQNKSQAKKKILLDFTFI